MPTVRIGPTYSNLREYTVNDDEHPILVDSPHFTGYITVRLQNHHHLSDPVLKTNPYFRGHRRFFSFQFQGRFKPTNPNRPSDHLWTYDDVLFCAETESKIAPPFGASLAVKFAKYIDPGFTAEGMFLEKRPWAGSWLVCGMNVIKVWPAKDDEKFSPKYLKNDFLTVPSKQGRKGARLNKFSKLSSLSVNNIYPFSNKEGSTSSSSVASASSTISSSSYTSFATDSDSDSDEFLARSAEPLLPIGPWIYYGEHHLEEDTKYLIPEFSDKSLTHAKRRQYFLDPKTRQSHVFDPSLVYACDFFNNFTDFSNMCADMMIKFDITSLLRRQPLQFACRNREGNAVFFVIEIAYDDL